ncbi:MAG: SH3 domain-containing protein [Fulvivirga sp.]|nr:SH3 domain-containing protein [Fulvivirga sp.]
MSAQSSVQDTLQTADSLFSQGKYTESFEIYKYILKEEKQVSPAMLLRMSFIQEGLNNYTESLYYLNLYYLKTADRKVLDKMEELADEKGLYGYDFNDWEFIQTIFYRYFFHFTAILLALSMLLLSVAYYLKFKKQQSAAIPSFFLVITLGLLFYTINYGKNYRKSLIYENSTFIMTGPSAGAEVLTIANKGNRVDVKGQEDVWTKIEWKGQTGYIKKSKLKPISF